MNKKVYLAGPIEGLLYEEAVEWRNKAEEILIDSGLSCYNPGVFIPDYLKGERITLEAVAKITETFVLDLKDRLYFHSRFELEDCSIILFNLKHSETTPISIGTFWELGAASIISKLNLAFNMPQKFKRNPFVSNSINLGFESLDEALDYIRRL